MPVIKIGTNIAIVFYPAVVLLALLLCVCVCVCVWFAVLSLNSCYDLGVFSTVAMFLILLLCFIYYCFFLIIICCCFFGFAGVF